MHVLGCRKIQGRPKCVYLPGSYSWMQSDTAYANTNSYHSCTYQHGNPEASENVT